MVIIWSSIDELNNSLFLGLQMDTIGLLFDNTFTLWPMGIQLDAIGLLFDSTFTMGIHLDAIGLLDFCM